MIVTGYRVLLVECKYKGRPDREQFTRWRKMAEVLGRRLNRPVHCAMILEATDDRESWVDVPVVLWSEIEAHLKELV